VASAYAPFVRVASTVFSEAESSETVEAVASEVTAFETSIYVGNISFGTLESDIRNVFGAHGSVSKVAIPIDRATGRSRGFAFVTMSNAEEHAAAIAALNELELDGRTIYVNESSPKERVASNRTRDSPRRNSPRDRGSKLYVGNLNFGTTAEELQSAFAEYGEVKDVYLPSDYDGNPRGFAFVQMEEENALKAIEGLNGVELGGRALNVKKSLPKGASNAR
jgi:nucleolin